MIERIQRIVHALMPSRHAIAVYRQVIEDQAATIDRAAGLLMAVRAQIQRIDTLRDLNIDGYEIEALKNLVDDHEELESRIEAVIAIEGVHIYLNATQDPEGGDWCYVLERDEVHRLLRGGQRIPNTVEGLDV